MRLVYIGVLENKYHVRQMKVGYLSRCGVSCSLADSQFVHVPADVVVFRLFVVAYTSDRMVTHRVILVFYNSHELLLSLQNVYSFGGSLGTTAVCRLSAYGAKILDSLPAPYKRPYLLVVLDTQVVFSSDGGGKHRVLYWSWREVSI